MTIHPAVRAVLIAAVCAEIVACAAAQTQTATASLKPAAVKCEETTGSKVRRAKAAECGQSVRAFGTVTREEMERGSPAYGFRDGIK